MTATMDDIADQGAGREPAMPALYDLRIALADHQLDASIVFRDGRPHLLIDKTLMLVRWDGDHFAWRADGPSTSANDIGQHEDDDVDAAAAAVSTAVNEVLVRRLTDQTQGAPGRGAPDDLTVSMTGLHFNAALADSSASPASGENAEFEQACVALRCGTLHFHELSPGAATAAERSSPAQAAGEALAEALNSLYDDSATAVPINRWVSAIFVCPALVALTDAIGVVWLRPARPGEPAKLRATQPPHNAVQPLIRERAFIHASRAPSPSA